MLIAHRGHVFDDRVHGNVGTYALCEPGERQNRPRELGVPSHEAEAPFEVAGGTGLIARGAGRGEKQAPVREAPQQGNEDAESSPE